MGIALEMINTLIYILIFAGAALMVFNVAGFIRFERFVRSRRAWNGSNAILIVPVILVAMFLVGYVVVGAFGKPDIVMALILFFGSIFVTIMYRLLMSITNRIIEAEEIETELRAAEEANKAKSEFLGEMSHEMRTPLNVILGINSLALRDKDLKPETREQFVKIGDSARRMLTLVDGLLKMDISRDAALSSQAGITDDDAGEFPEECRVLVVDDIIENAEIVMDLLDLEDVKCDYAENGLRALEMFEASEPGYYDLILMDLRMPVMDGHESARRIRALDRSDAKRVPIVALTANASEEDVKKTAESGMDEHLAKPTESEYLYTILKRLIREYRKDDQRRRT